MRYVPLLLSWLCIVLVPMFVVSLVVTNLFFNVGFYEQGQAKYDVQSTTGMSVAAIHRVDGGIVRFFGGSMSLPAALKSAGADPNVFKEKEILHMNDVRSLVQAMGQIGNVSLLVFVAYVLLAFVVDKRDGRAAVARTFFGGGVLTIALVVITGVLTYTSFDSLFLTFHELAFRNNFWELDPRTDHLIQMFPFGFWYDAILTVALRVVIVAVVFSVAGAFIRRFDRRHV